jgi:hypothetical protein
MPQCLTQRASVAVHWKNVTVVYREKKSKQRRLLAEQIFLLLTTDPTGYSYRVAFLSVPIMYIKTWTFFF